MQTTVSRPINEDWGVEDIKIAPRFCVFVRRKVKIPPRCHDKRKFRLAKLKVPVVSAMAVYTVEFPDCKYGYDGCRQLLGWTRWDLYKGVAPKMFWPAGVFNSMDAALAAAQRMQDTFGNVPEDNVMYPDTYPADTCPTNLF